MKWISILAIAYICVHRADAQQSPSITSQPTNQTVASGGTATFRVSASGSQPLSYSWFFNNSPLSNLLTTVAGGYIGDNLAAINATLSIPICVAADHIGNVIIADTLNYRIRMVMTN